MTWFKVDDGFTEHPKLADLEEQPRLWSEVVSLWLAAGCYCAKHLTNGHVPKRKLRRLVPFRCTRAARALISRRLWTETETDYVFHDWAEYQPTREHVLSERRATRERVTKWRTKRPDEEIGNGVTNTVTRPIGNGVTGAVTNAVSNGPPVPSRPVPSRPIPINRPPGGGLMRVRAHEEPAAAEWFSVDTVAEIFDEERRAAGGKRYRGAHSDYRKREDVVEWARAAAEDEGTTPAEVVRRSVRAFMHAADDNSRAQHHPFAFWANDPGRWLAASEAQRTEQHSSEYQRLREQREEAWRRRDHDEHRRLQNEIDELLGTA